MIKKYVLLNMKKKHLCTLLDSNQRGKLYKKNLVNEMKIL